MELVSWEFRDEGPRRELLRPPCVRRDEGPRRELFTVAVSTIIFLFWSEDLARSCFLFFSTGPPPLLIVSFLSRPVLNRLDLFINRLDFVLSKLGFLPLKNKMCVKLRFQYGTKGDNSTVCMNMKSFYDVNAIKKNNK